MLEDLANLLDQSAASGTPVRTIVGNDLVSITSTISRDPEAAIPVRTMEKSYSELPVPVPTTTVKLCERLLGLRHHQSWCGRLC
jgi:hypothetical protein